MIPLRVVQQSHSFAKVRWFVNMRSIFERLIKKLCTKQSSNPELTPVRDIYENVLLFIIFGSISSFTLKPALFNIK